MRLKLFRAGGMAEAMAQVRRELGADALILSTRSVSGGVEVTAARDDTRPPPEADPEAARILAFHGVTGTFAALLGNGPLTQTLAANLRFASLALANWSAPVLFAGPPGAGKTLTVARLATRLVLSGIHPLVITADAERAGAAEQLAAFTRLLGLDLLVASHPVALSRALARRVDGVPVLIDLPGHSPFDETRSGQLADLCATAAGRVAVVLPAGLDCAEAAETAAAFAETGAGDLVITRLDVARRLGCVLAAGRAGLALTEAGIGPGAADGLVPLTAELLANRLSDMSQARRLH